MKYTVQLKDLSKTYKHGIQKRVPALLDVSFGVKEKEFVSIVGPSGCGKSTLIKIVAGLVKSDSGSVKVNGTLIDGPGKDRGMMFQEDNIFPWLNVRQNIEFGLDLLGFSEKKKQTISKRFIKSMGLRGFEDAYPQTLSGGMKERVALARTLAADPEILLMDEPFSDLDMQTKRFMQDLLLQIWEKKKKTILFVTHDVDEALFLSDRVLVMTNRPGEIRESVKVTLPRPRTFETEFDAAYIKIKKRVQRLITEESMKSLDASLSRTLKDIY